jgi:predicted amidohydrolase YtcJ
MNKTPSHLKNNPTLNSNLKIERCYDSHVHLFSTGEYASALNLKEIKKFQDLSNLKITEKNFRKHWLMGFGWNQFESFEISQLHRKHLDSIFKDIPVSFTRVDSHSILVNTAALQELNLMNTFLNEQFGEEAPLDSENKPTGFLSERAKKFFEKKIPKFTTSQLKGFLQESLNIFNSYGTTHLRDMTIETEIWNLQAQMAEQKDWTLASEHYFYCPNFEKCESTIKEALIAQKNAPAKMRCLGLKIFIDGALGSETAYLREPYVGQSSRGFLLWKEKDFQETLKLIWQANLEVAIHTIGDGSTEWVLDQIISLNQNGFHGKVALEHVEILDLELIKKIKQVGATCYLQPSQWLSDHQWLEKKLGSRVQQTFAWNLLETEKVPFFFGTDSPIEPADNLLNIKAVKEAAQKGWAPTILPAAHYLSHPDPHFFGQSFSEWDENNNLVKLVFDQQEVIKLK